MGIVKKGRHCVIGNKVYIGKNVYVGHNCIFEDNVTIDDNAYIESNVIIRSGVRIGKGAFIQANCILGEYLMDFCLTREYHDQFLKIGDYALIRSGSIIYTGSMIGDHFQTGHQVTIREKSLIGNNVSIGTLSDVQGNCKIGNYVRMHSNVHIGQLSEIDDFVWIYPYVVLTNDPTPPSEHFAGVHVHPFAVIATSSLIMPGLEIGQDSLVAGGAVVTKSVEPYSVVAGNPAKYISDVRKIKNKITGEPVYPWREHFHRAMPWENSDFLSWYNSLTIDEKATYCMDT